MSNRELIQIIKVASQGRIVLPVEVRRRLGWDFGTKLRVIIEGDEVVLEETTSAREEASG